MAINDPIADLLTRIRNAQRIGREVTASPASKARVRVLDVLKREGYIADYSQREVRKGIHEIEVKLRYHNDEPVIREVHRVSKPGRRVYSNVKDLPRIYGGLGIYVLSTSKGVMSDNDARAAGIGGEVICSVF
ncbi:MAG: 30S ribosomal protein S8 [Pseudomonadota bacterium]